MLSSLKESHPGGGGVGGGGGGVHCMFIKRKNKKRENKNTLSDLTCDDYIYKWVCMYTYNEEMD